MDYYDEFGISPNSSSADVREAYKNLARLLHPDNFREDRLRALAERQMQRVNLIYGVLLDPARRRMYDLERANPPLSLLHAPVWREGLHTHWAWLIAAIAAGFAVYLYLRPLPHVAGAPSKPPILEPGPGRAASPPRPAPDLERIRRLKHENEELRRQLEEALAERDQIAARLSATTAQSVLPAPAPAPEPPRPASAPVSNTTPQAGEKASPHRLAGTWIYVARAKPSPNELYPPDYIELVIVEQDKNLSGRYRARYRVSDRALSPEVEFSFAASRTAGARDESGGSVDRFEWRGNSGARGEVQLRLITDTTLSVDWFTRQLGSESSLTSGSAVLVRKLEP